MIHCEYVDLKCPKCSYQVKALYGTGFLGFPGDDTLREDILAGRKGAEAKTVLERYPDSEARLTSYFYRCPKCRILSSHIRTIIYEKKGWANDYNLFTEKVTCPDCSIQLEEVSPETFYTISCPECNSIMDATDGGFWD